MIRHPLEPLGLYWGWDKNKRLKKIQALKVTLNIFSSHRSQRTLRKWLRKSAKAKRMRSNLLWKVKSKKRNQLDSMNKKTQRINKALKSITKSQRKAYLISLIKNSKRKFILRLILLKKIINKNRQPIKLASIPFK